MAEVISPEDHFAITNAVLFESAPPTDSTQHRISYPPTADITEEPVSLHKPVMIVDQITYIEPRFNPKPIIVSDSVIEHDQPSSSDAAPLSLTSDSETDIGSPVSENSPPSSLIVNSSDPELGRGLRPKFMPKKFEHYALNTISSVIKALIVLPHRLEFYVDYSNFSEKHCQFLAVI